MTPVTGATFPIAMRRSAPSLGAERGQRTSVLVSADAGQASLLLCLHVHWCLLLWLHVQWRLLLWPHVRWRRRKNGGNLKSRAPDDRLMAVGVEPTRSGFLFKGGDLQPQAPSRCSRALIRPRIGRQLDSRLIATPR